MKEESTESQLVREKAKRLAKLEEGCSVTAGDFNTLIKELDSMKVSSITTKIATQKDIDEFVIRRNMELE